jgi:hypothetical protein
VDGDWVFREGPEPEDVELAGQVKAYTRMENGRPEQVRTYQRAWWVPHPDWVKGEQRWVTAGEAQWNQRGEQARAEREASRRAQESADDTTRTARSAETGSAARSAEQPSPQLGQQGRPAHNYLDPDPERLVNEKGTYKSPADHPFFQRNPVSSDNLVSAWKDLTPGERNQALRWYADGHRLAWALGGGDAELGAKVLSAYSPRTGWPLNMFNAARSLAENRALGPGEGTIMGAHQKAADAAMKGADIDTVFPSPKTNAFARLLALGEDHPEDGLGQVVIDRHALSAAAGRRLRKEDTEGKGEFKSPVGDPRMYEHVADQYRTAARQVSDEEGEEIAPHQLQAGAWLRQIRLNNAEDQSGTGPRNKGLMTSMRNHWTAWQQWAKEHGVRTELGTTDLSPAPVTKAEAGPGSRPLDAVEYHATASRGRDLLNQMESDRKPLTGAAANWDSLKTSAWKEVSKPWGHLVVDARTGEPLEAGADKYVLTVKPPGFSAITLPENAAEPDFQAAMDRALVEFRVLLEQSGFHLGIFHDDGNHRIDIDPVAVAEDRADAEALAAYTRNTGGAYHLGTGQVIHAPYQADAPKPSGR